MQNSETIGYMSRGGLRAPIFASPLPFPSLPFLPRLPSLPFLAYFSDFLKRQRKKKKYAAPEVKIPAEKMMISKPPRLPQIPLINLSSLP